LLGNSRLALDTTTNQDKQDLITLVRIYNKKLRYTRSVDKLDKRLRVFKDTCKRAGVRQEQYYKAFSTILANKASNFYFDNLLGKGLTFKELV
jgi:hypothetical protein